MARTYAGTLDALYVAAAEPDEWTAALEHLADYIGGSGAMLVFNDLDNNTGFLITARLREDLGQVYVRDHIHNPVTQAMVQQVAGTPVVASHLTGRERLSRSALHADILAPQRITDLLCLAQSSFSRQGTSGGIAVTIDQRQSEHLVPLTSRLTRLAPHLARAVDLSLAISQAHAQFGAVATLIQAMPNAALLLDGQARVLLANDTATRLLETNDGVSLGAGGRLVASLVQERGRMEKAVAGALNEMAARRLAVPSAVSVARPSGQPGYLVHITVLPPNASALRAMVAREARLLIEIIDPGAPLAAAAQRIKSVFTLTWAEARVAVLVGSGRSVPETAAALGIGASTVKTHLARCFDKTGVRSQVALARLLAALPAGGSGTYEA